MRQVLGVHQKKGNVSLTCKAAKLQFNGQKNFRHFLTVKNEIIPLPSQVLRYDTLIFGCDLGIHTSVYWVSGLKGGRKHDQELKDYLCEELNRKCGARNLWHHSQED